METTKNTDQNLSASLRSLPRAVWVLCAGMFVNKFGAFVVPFLTIYMSSRGFSKGEIGLALSGYGIGNFGAAIAGGILADRIGRRKTIVVSMFSGAVAMMVLSQAQGYWILVALTTVAGFASELYRPAAAALITDLVSAKNRVLAFAVYRVSFNAGWMFGPAVGGLLAGLSYFYLFVGEALTCLVFGLVAWRFLPIGVKGDPISGGIAGSVRVIFRDGNLRLLLVTFLIVGGLFFQMASTYSVFVTGLGYSEWFYGVLIGANGFLVVLLEVPMTRVTARFAPRYVIAAGYLFIATGVAMNAAFEGRAWLFFAMAVFSLGEIIAMPVAMAVVSGLAPANARGRYMGAVGFSWSLALIVGPAAGLWLFGLVGSLFWVIAGSIGLLAAVLVLFLSGSAVDEEGDGGSEKHLADPGDRA